MFKKALFTLTFLCALIAPSFQTFAMESGAQQPLQMKSGKIILKNETDMTTYQSALEEALRANDGGEKALKLFKGAFALKGLNDEAYKARALETFFKNILTLNTDTLKTLLPSFTEHEQTETVQKRLDELLTAELLEEEREAARILLEKEQEAIRVQLEKEQETIRIQQEKRHAQEEADRELSEFYGRVESLLQRITTLSSSQGNGDSLNILQTDIDFAFCILQDAFIKNSEMPQEHKQLALEYMHNIYTELQKHPKYFQEQITRLTRFFASNSPSNRQLVTPAQEASVIESAAHEKRTPLSPTELQTVREQRLRHFQHTVVEQQANTETTTDSSSAQPIRRSNGKGRRPDDHGEESDEVYAQAQDAIRSGDKVRLKKISRELDSNSPLKGAVDRALASLQPSSSTGQTNPQNVDQTEQQPRRTAVPTSTRTNQKQPHYAQVNQEAPVLQQPWYIRYSIGVKRCTREVKENITVKINSAYHWLKQNSAIVKVGLAATVMSAYFWYNNYRR